MYRQDYLQRIVFTQMFNKSLTNVLKCCIPPSTFVASSIFLSGEPAQGSHLAESGHTQSPRIVTTIKAIV